MIDNTFYGYKKGDKIRCKKDFMVPRVMPDGTFNGTMIGLKKGRLYPLHSFSGLYQANIICENGMILPMEDDEMREFFKMKKYIPPKQNKNDKLFAGVCGYSYGGDQPTSFMICK